MAYPRFRQSRAHKFIRRTSSITITATTWTALDTTVLDMVLRGQVGDVIEYYIAGEWAANETAIAFIDVATVVSGSLTNSLAANTTLTEANSSGGRAWLGRASGVGGAEASFLRPFAGSIFYTLLAGDISSGQVTLRPVGRVPSGSRQMQGSATSPAVFAAKNLGPPAT